MPAGLCGQSEVCSCCGPVQISPEESAKRAEYGNERYEKIEFQVKVGVSAAGCLLGASGCAAVHDAALHTATSDAYWEQLSTAQGLFAAQHRLVGTQLHKVVIVCTIACKNVGLLLGLLHENNDAKMDTCDVPMAAGSSVF